jgi:hypothetical protein
MNAIAKEEIWRSIPVCFFSFLIVGLVKLGGYISIETSVQFTLPLLITIIHFTIMVWYRRKENLENSSINLILKHALTIKDGTNKRNSEIQIKIIAFLTLCVIYLIYIYSSIMYNINQIFWILVLIIVADKVSKIFFVKNDTYVINLKNWIFFYITCSIFILARYFALKQPVLPMLKGIAILGIVSIGFFWIYEQIDATNDNRF